MNFANFDLNLLKVLDALFQEGSTIKAAERLHMSQSAVSGALSRLRYSLKDDLFVRQGNRLVATDYARAIELGVRLELERLEELLVPLKPFNPAEAQGRFVIGASDYFAELLMPSLARRVSAEAPDLTVQLVDFGFDPHLQRIRDAEVDIELLTDRELPSWAEASHLLYSDFVVIAAKDNPRVTASGVSPGETFPLDLYCEMGHVVFSQQGAIRAMGDAALERVGRKRRVVMTLPVFSGVYWAVAESDLIALLPRRLAEHVEANLGLHSYAVPMQVTPGHLLSIWHKRSTKDPQHQWMRNLVTELMAPLCTGLG